MIETPILYVTFNRPDSVLKTIEPILNIKPKNLFLVSDAPRHAKDHDSVHACRKILEDKTKNLANLRKIYREKNYGCARNISSAVSEVLEQFDDVIILEDDCLAEESFFYFCAELLKKFEGDTRLWTITGNNFQFGKTDNDWESYYYSCYPHCWGWATWKRAWKNYDHEMKLWPQAREKGVLSDVLIQPHAVKYWDRVFQDVYEGKIDSWNIRWMLSTWLNSALTIIPKVNLVSNIGFGEHASRTSTKNRLAELPKKNLDFPLIHNDFVVRSFRRDFTTQSLYNMSRLQLLKDRTWSWMFGNK